ncbi:MAG: hypothetical protein PHN69_02570 [Candidatus Pacebacteria bacterium]|nr:hypothetical protein [Candidatus Paceibacterota bacterium]
MIIAACDPGSNGAFIAMDKNGNTLYQFVFKNNKDGEFDIKYFSDNVKDFLQKYSNNSIIFYIEDVHSLFGMSAKSNFSFGKNCGMIEASIITLGYEVYKVTPKDWQKEMLKGIEVIKKIKKEKYKEYDPDTFEQVEKIRLVETKKNDVKAMSLKAQEKHFPDFNSRASDRCKMPHDGLVDALLIAEYARRTHKNTRDEA